MPSHGPRPSHSLRAGSRQISPAHLARLREIVAAVGSHERVARDILRVSPDSLLDALTSKVFRQATAESLERKIDAAGS